MEKGQCVVSEVILKEGNVPPIIANFENGDLKLEVGAVRKCGIFRNNSDPAKYIVAVNTRDDMLYMGTEASEEPYRMFLAVENRGNHNVRMIEVDKVTLKSKSAIPSAPVSREGTQAELYKTFGSKQIKRKTEQKERMSVNVESFSERLQDTATNINVGDSLDTLDDTEYYGTCVPCNRNATNVNDVYNVENIISMSELEELRDEVEAIFSNDDETNAQDYSSFLNENLKDLPTQNRFYYAQILLYAECLVQFLSTKTSQLYKKNVVVCPFSETINNKILKEFTVVVEKCRKMPPTLKNKALSHAIVAGLIACRFSLKIQSLFELTRTTQENLFKLCRTLGAVPQSKDKRNTIVLKVPLPILPKSRVKKRRS